MCVNLNHSTQCLKTHITKSIALLGLFLPSGRVNKVARKQPDVLVMNFFYTFLLTLQIAQKQNLLVMFVDLNNPTPSSEQQCRNDK